LCLGGAVVASFAIAWVGLNLYVQSQGTQARIQQELSQRIAAPVQFRSSSVTPWGGLTLSGIRLGPAVPGKATDFLDAKSFHLHVQLLSLLTKSLVISKVTLVDPTVVWPQGPDGRWRLPEATPTPPRQGSAAPRAAAKPSKARTHLVPQVRRVKLTGGNFKFLDRSGKLTAAFDGVSFHAGVRSPLALNGSAKIAKASLRDRFFVDELRSPLHYEANALELPKISARIGHGDVSAKFSMQPETPDSPFSVNVEFRNVQADQIVSQAGGPKGMLQGKLDGKLQAEGKTADPNALTGSGEIVLRDGQLQQYSLLVALGQVLQIEELTQLHLQQAEAKYHLTPGLVAVDELVLQSPNMRLSATGTITFDGKLQLDAQLAVNDDVRAKLFKPIRDNFHPIAEPGYSALGFQVGGTIDRPRSNLVERMVGRDLKDLVSEFFGGKKSKKKTSSEPSPAGTEELTPTPPAADTNIGATPTPVAP
jgi:hypothetical protein